MFYHTYSQAWRLTTHNPSISLLQIWTFKTFQAIKIVRIWLKFTLIISRHFFRSVPELGSPYSPIGGSLNQTPNWRGSSMVLLSICFGSSHKTTMLLLRHRLFKNLKFLFFFRYLHCYDDNLNWQTKGCNILTKQCTTDHSLWLIKICVFSDYEVSKRICNIYCINHSLCTGCKCYNCYNINLSSCEHLFFIISISKTHKNEK